MNQDYLLREIRRLSDRIHAGDYRGCDELKTIAKELSDRFRDLDFILYNGGRQPNWRTR